MLNQEQVSDSTSNEEYGKTLPNVTGITTQFFNCLPSDANESFDLSKEYLKSEFSDKEELYGEMQSNSITKLQTVFLKFLLKLAFYKLSEVPVKKSQLSHEQKQKEIYKSLYKIELLLYRKLWVRMQMCFAKIVNEGKASSKPKFRHKNGVKKLVQFLQCWQTKENIKSKMKSFGEIKKKWQLGEKIQIFASILNEVEKKYLTVEQGFQNLKKLSHKYERVSISIQSLSILFNSSLLQAFNLIKNFTTFHHEDTKTKLCKKFRRVKGTHKERDSSEKNEPKSKEGSQKIQTLKFNKLIRKKNDVLKLEDRSKSLKKWNFQVKERNGAAKINIKQKNQQFSLLLSSSLFEKQLSYDSSAWHNFNPSKKLQYLRPQQTQLISEDSCDLMTCFPLSFRHDIKKEKRQSCQSCRSEESIYFRKSKQFKRERKKEKKTNQEENNSEEKRNLEALGNYYFPEQNYRTKEPCGYTPTKRLRSHFDGKESKIFKMNKVPIFKKNGEKTKNIEYQFHFSPQLEKYKNRYSGYRNSPTKSKVDLFSKSPEKQKGVSEKYTREWKFHKISPKNQSITNHYFEIGTYSQKQLPDNRGHYFRSGKKI